MPRFPALLTASSNFDRVLADPAHPSAIAAAYDSGDHLYSNDAGYKAMGEAIDLKLFQ